MLTRFPIIKKYPILWASTEPLKMTMNDTYQPNPTPRMPGTSKIFHRSEANAVLGGVCAGIAEYFEADVMLVRVATVVLSLVMNGFTVPAYLVLWFFLPTETTMHTVNQKDIWTKIIIALIFIMFVLPILAFSSALFFLGFFPMVMGLVFGGF